MQPDGSCLDPWGIDGYISCNLIRECDPYTGAMHWEYAMPEGSDNANIAVYDGGKWTWNDAQGNSAAFPSGMNTPLPSAEQIAGTEPLFDIGPGATANYNNAPGWTATPTPWGTVNQAGGGFMAPVQQQNQPGNSSAPASNTAPGQNVLGSGTKSTGEKLEDGGKKTSDGAGLDIGAWIQDNMMLVLGAGAVVVFLALRKG